MKFSFPFIVLQFTVFIRFGAGRLGSGENKMLLIFKTLEFSIFLFRIGWTRSRRIPVFGQRLQRKRAVASTEPRRQWSQWPVQGPFTGRTIANGHLHRRRERLSS